MKTRDREKESRESIALMVLILLLGFICIILASGWALRFAPSWRLPADMGSNLNPDSDFLTGVPVSFFEPLDPSILTNPAWFDVFLTPGASFATLPPLPTSTHTPAPTNTNTGIPVITNSPTNTPIPTNTVIFFPPFTPTPKPPNTARPPRDTPTATSVPITSADLQITKTDGVAFYLPGGPPLTYTITITNNGPSDVVGAVIADPIPAQITTWTWACTSQTGGATGCDAVAGSSADFIDTVDLPVGGIITYTVTANPSASATGNLTNTALVSVPSGYADPDPGNDSAADTDAPLIVPSADLAITKDDFVTTYTPGGTLTYTITVTNNSGSDVVGAVVTDNIPTGQIASWDWVCFSQAGGASGCDGVAGSNANFTDIVDLPVGGSIVYIVTANIDPAATGDLTNTAIVGFAFDDPMPGNNTATDTDTP